MNAFLHKLRYLFNRRSKEQDLRDELQFHLEEDAEERRAGGHPLDDARLAAKRSFGNVARIGEETRDAWTWTYLEQLLQDCRYALRTIAANRTFSLLVILSLGLGIGANTAIYSFMDSLLLRSLPVADPNSLVVINWAANPAGRDFVMHGMSGSTWSESNWKEVSGIFPFPAFELLSSKSGDVLSSVFAYYPTRKVNLIVSGQAEQGGGEFVSGDYFRGLEVPPAAGRVLLPEDDRFGAPPVAVLSYSYSQKRFGDATSATGKTLLINDVPFMIAGVAPAGFFGVDPATAPDFYIPLHTNVLLRPRGGASKSEEYLDQNYYWLEMMGRLRPGVTRERAQAELGPAFHQWVNSTAANDRERASLPQLLIREGAAGLNTLRRQYSKPLYVLLGMVALILAIACANIANLMLARATARRHEFAVRLSIGAGRFRVIRQLLTESLVLASIGGALGVAFAVWGIRFLTLLLANGRADFTLRPQLNWHVLAAAVVLSLLTGLLFGLAPALRSTRVDVMPALKLTTAEEPIGRHKWRGVNLSHVLVVTQIGMAVLMLVGSGLFLRTLSNLQSIQLGFNRENVILFKLNARQAGHQDPEILTFYGDLRKSFSAIPGVRNASASHSALLGEGTWSSMVAPVGEVPKGATNILMTAPSFFETMQIPIVKGRPFEERDQPGSTPVAVVSESFVRKYFPDRNPLGQHIVIRRRQKPGSDIEIVGVAKDARYGELKGAFREIAYLPFNQGTYYPVEEMTFALRTVGDPSRYLDTIRAIVSRADTHVPVTDIRTQEAQVDRLINQEIIFARLCTAFAALALLIASVGLYGMMSYTVARRTGEIGIRMALGAQRGNVVWMVLRQVFILASVGLAIGVPAALGTSRFIESFLFDVKPNSASAVAVAVGILLCVVLVAGYLPARRASRIDPLTAVRHE